jgi:hypothetical protein
MLERDKAGPKPCERRHWAQALANTLARAVVSVRSAKAEKRAMI